METVIQKAIEGGWGGKLKPSVIVSMLPNKCVGFRYPDSFDGVSMSIYDILCQPLFWQALGKSLGWKTHDTYIRHGSLGKRVEITPSPEWRRKWVRFIHHLASGGDAESFFNTLLN